MEGGRHASKRQGSVDSRTGNAPREGRGWASVSLQSVAARTRASMTGLLNVQIFGLELPTEDPTSNSRKLCLIFAETAAMSCVFLRLKNNLLLKDGQTFLRLYAFFFFSLLCLRGNKYPKAIQVKHCALIT